MIDATDEELDVLVGKIDGNLPSRKEGGREYFRLEVTLRERNILAEALRKCPAR